MQATPAAGATPVHLIVVPHTHWDREWYQPFQEFRQRLVRLTDRLLALLERDPAFTHFHFDGQTIVLEDYLEIRPENRARLRRLIRNGRVAVGPWYVLPDEFLVSGESIIRNLIIGHRVAGEFGRPLQLGYLPDQFGHIAQMPQVLKGFGIDGAVVWRGVGADVDRSEFLWEAPDGSRLFAVYLPRAGYSNGRSLPEEPAALRARLLALLEEYAPYRRTDVQLVMNGTDHQEPQEGLPAALPQALHGLEGLTAEIAPLAAYVERARRVAGEGLPLHRGELRSPLRAHLLPGVTSMRVRQKQRDFDNVARLERYAEPLAAWADWLAGNHDLTGFTEWAWKLAVQNHPHDSICGCSVDQVHQDMEYRFDQVEAVGKQVLRQALTAVTARIDTSQSRSDTVLAVYNPNHATRTVVTAEVYHDQPPALTLRDAGGRPLPTQASAGGSETLLDAELPPAEVRPHVLAIQGREFLGLFINAIRFRREAERLDVDLTVDRQRRGRLDIGAERQRWLAHLDDPTVATVRIAARTGNAVELRFVAELTGRGFTLFSLGTAEQKAPSPFTVGDRSIENQFYRVTVNEADGSVAVLDKDLGLELPRCNWFVDEGDRGDEYNFDALLDAQAVLAPAAPPTIAVEVGPVSASLRLTLPYSLPRRLENDRETRSAERVTVPIETTVRLHAGVKRIDFTTDVDNLAHDHRLRVHFQTPIHSPSTQSEQAFAVVERPLALESADGPEQPIGTVPQKTFTCIEANGVGVALFNRGLQEVEALAKADGIDLALTLVRAVGWLSRSDLRMRNGHAGPGLETPGAQSPGRHRFAYALTSYAGTYASAGIVHQAHDFAYPPIAMTTEGHAGNGTAATLVACDNPNVVVSAVTPSRRPQHVLVRCYNTTPTPQTCHLEIPGAAQLKGVNFLEQPSRKRIRRQGQGWRVAFGPAEIVTLQAVRAQ